MIPCHNCLVLPACKNKMEIRCSILHKWYTERIFTKDEALKTSKILEKYIPRWREEETITIFREDCI